MVTFGGARPASLSRLIASQWYIADVRRAHAHLSVEPFAGLRRLSCVRLFTRAPIVGARGREGTNGLINDGPTLDNRLCDNDAGRRIDA